MEPSDPAESNDKYDEELLKKLRGMYASCMNEDLLNARGADPLIRIIKNVRKLFSGKPTVINSQDSDHLAVPLDGDKKRDRDSLTAAVAYLHSRGISALFDFEIEGDAGVGAYAARREHVRLLTDEFA